MGKVPASQQPPKSPEGDFKKYQDMNGVKYFLMTVKIQNIYVYWMLNPESMPFNFFGFKFFP